MTEEETRQALKKKSYRKREGKTSECPRCLSTRTIYCTPKSRELIRCNNCGYVAKIAQWKEESRERKAGFKQKELL